MRAPIGGTIKKLTLCSVLFAMSACASNFEDFNSWYGNAAYQNYSDSDMRAAKEEIARLKAQQQRYADIQTVQTRQQSRQEPARVVQPAAQPQPQPVYYRRDDQRSDAGSVSNGPLFPASVNRSPSLAETYRTAQAPSETSSIWNRLWPSSAQ